jgi:hypothetical protein
MTLTVVACNIYHDAFDELFETMSEELIVDIEVIFQSHYWMTV